MDEKTSLLICLGASTAANCIPCFAYYHRRASTAGISSDEILESIELANKVKSGAQLAMRNSIKDFTGWETSPPACGCGPAKTSCCD